MFKKVILVEGVNDLAFIDWLILKSEIDISRSLVKLVKVGGKSFFQSYIENKIIGMVNDTQNKIDYSEENEIKQILLIKDFDSDDSTIEYNDFALMLKDKHNIELVKYYIAGTVSPPKLLETLFIENDGELLKEFASTIKKFNQSRIDAGKDGLEKVNDKFIFHGFNKIQNKKIEYNSKIFDDMFGTTVFLELPDIKNLVEKIREFIKEKQ
ncbi:MAG: hypothetical protein QG651_430 [Pseudomonadota bacterium]|jgi:hypothetical protein|nr:hypothetical protein [Pseudomonadota bacterium]